MAVKQNLGAAIHAVNALDAFKTASTSHYKAAYVHLGKGAHLFGGFEFHTKEDLETGLRKTISDYNLDEKKFSVSVDSTCALFDFKNKGIHNQFMKAIYHPGETPSRFVVQVANKSREWHHKAGEYLSHANRERLEGTSRTDRAILKNVPSYGSALVDYSFPDLDMMRNFCAYIASGQIDRDEAVLKAVTQPDLVTHSVRRDIR